MQEPNQSPSLFTFARNNLRIWFDPNQPPSGGGNGEAGNGEAGNGNGDNNGGQQQSGPNLPGDVLAAYQNLVQRQGGVDATSLLLFQENYQYRERLRQQQEQLTRLQQQLPPDGAVVLQGDELTAWQTYQTLGTPDQLRQLATAQRDLLVMRAAQNAGYKENVLSTLLKPGDALEIAAPADGKDPIAYITPQGGERIPLIDYATTNWNDFLPALQVKPQGTQFHPQHVGRGGKNNPSIIDKRLADRKERQKNTNLLRPASSH